MRKGESFTGVGAACRIILFGEFQGRGGERVDRVGALQKAAGQDKPIADVPGVTLVHAGALVY